MKVIDKLCRLTSNEDRISRSFQTIKALLFLFALIVAFLFALNGRYSHAVGAAYFDKWTQKGFIVDFQKRQVLDYDR